PSDPAFEKRRTGCSPASGVILAILRCAASPSGCCGGDRNSQGFLGNLPGSLGSGLLRAGWSSDGDADAALLARASWGLSDRHTGRQGDARLAGCELPKAALGVRAAFLSETPSAAYEASAVSVANLAV